MAVDGPGATESPSAGAVPGVLRLAFSDESEATSEALSEEVVRAAEILGLADRIAERFPDRAPQRWRESLRRQASGAILLEVALERVAQAAASRATPLILLKGMALIRGGFTSPGRRPLADLDVLVAPDAVPALEERLRAGGFEPYEEPEGAYHHHRAPLIHPELGVVEIHTRLPGVRMGVAEATAEAVLGGDLAMPDTGLGSVHVPRPALLAAHTIAHCLYQERYLGTGIGFFRMLGDLVDLEREGGVGGAVEAARPFVAGVLPEADLETLGALVRALRRGEVPEEAAWGMVDRFVGAALRPEETRTRLRWKRRWHVLRMRGGWRRLLARIVPWR